MSWDTWRVPPGTAPLKRVAMLNRWLGGAWAAGMLPEPELSLETLQAAAFGREGYAVVEEDHDWRAALSLLLQALSGEAELNPLGRTMAYGLIVKALRDRREARRLWERHPGILDWPVTAPVIILGPMRSGTTRIQRLLACDRRFVHTRLFETLSPVPREKDLAFSRPVKALAGVQLLRFLNPALGAIHPTGVFAPEEEFGLFNPSFGSAQFEAQWRVPSFARWWEEADTRPLYAEFRRLLQTIGWCRGDAADKPWVLKAPQFMQDLGAVLETFPDARLICLHRDLAQVVGSSASLVWNQMRIQSDRADRHWIGREWLRKTRLRLERAEEARRANPQVPQMDVEYSAVNGDWRREMRRIYAFLELELTPAVERRMQTYVRSARAHLGHRYSLGEFGLSEADVEGG